MGAPGIPPIGIAGGGAAGPPGGIGGICGIGPGPALANTRQSAEQFARQAAGVPLQRGPELAEFAAAMRFLLSARSFTGQMLALDGGQHLNWGATRPGEEPEE